MSVADYPDYATPQAHATAIAGTGVPLLASPAGLITLNGQNIAAAGQYQSPVTPVAQTGYTTYVNVSFPAAATVPFVEVTLDWIDSATATLVAEDHYFLAGNTSGIGLVTFGSGLAKGNELQLTIANLDPAQAVTVAMHMNQDSVPRLIERWYWRNTLVNGSTVPGLTLASLPDDESCLGILNSALIPAAGNASYLFGMAPGRVITLAGFMTTVAPANVNLQVRSAPEAVYGGNAYLGFFLPAAASFGFTFTAPRAPLTLKVSNTGTAAGQLDCMMTAQG